MFTLASKLIEYSPNEQAYYTVVNDKFVKRTPWVIVEKAEKSDVFH